MNLRLCGLPCAFEESSCRDLLS